MTVQQIQLEIESLVAMGPDVEKERPKVEFKSRWPNLKSEPGISEFLKDTSALANTVGLDGFLIFGYDPKKNQYHNVSLKDSNLRDQNEIRGLLIKGLSEPFDIELYTLTINGHNLDILHIPPSINKPHIIKLHRTYHSDGKIKTSEENRTLVRKNGGIYPATKYDLDFMYYDKKNIVPEYEAYVSIKLQQSSFVFHSYDRYMVIANVTITFENTGRRPFIIDDIRYALSLFEDDAPIQFIRRKDTVFEPVQNPIKTQEITQHSWQYSATNFTSYDQANEIAKDFEENKKHLNVWDFVIITTSGRKIVANVNKV